MLDYVTRYFDEIRTILDTIDKESICEMMDEIQQLRESGGRLFICGVGGSAANASHAVNDFRKILGLETYTPTDNVSELTARINDESWEESYINWLKVSKLSSKDAIMILSVGGGSDSTSQNLVKVMDYARTLNARVMAIVSRDGGHAKKTAHSCVLIPVIESDTITPHAEEWQGILWHMMVSGLARL